MTISQKRNHKKSFTGIRYDKLNDHEHTKPLKLESRSTKLLVSADNQQTSSEYDSILEEDVNTAQQDEDEDDCHDDDEETRFIRTDRDKTNKKISYYTSTERT